jgi:hypothetical protein
MAQIASGQAPPAPAPAPPPVLPAQAQLRAAGTWAAGRKGAVSWAVVDSAGRIHGRHAARRYPSASVTKALLLVAALRRTGGGRAVPPDLAVQLSPMITISSNRAAHAVYRRVGGDAALRSVARAAKLRRLKLDGTWSDVGVSAGDVARFFLVADRLVPPRHRVYARRLLEGITRTQSWGVPRALRPKGWRVFFKGGWRRGIVHQGALLERGGRRVAIAVLSDGNPSHDYGTATVHGIARRLLSTTPR